MTSLHDYSMLYTYPVVARDVTTKSFQLTQKHGALTVEHKKILAFLLVQLYIEYYMFNSEYEKLEPVLPENTFIKPFLAGRIDGSLFDKYKLSPDHPTPMPSFSELNTILSTINYRFTSPSDAIILYANMVYSVLYDQIGRCSDFASYRTKNRMHFNIECLYSIFTIKKILLDRTDLDNQYIVVDTHQFKWKSISLQVVYSHTFFTKNLYELILTTNISHTSLSLLNANINHEITHKLIKTMYTHICAKALLFECKNLHAEVWPEIADILMNLFGFIQMTKNADGDSILKWHRTKTPDGVYMDLTESIIPNDAMGNKIFNLHEHIFNEHIFYEMSPYIIAYKHMID